MLLVNEHPKRVGYRHDGPTQNATLTSNRWRRTANDSQIFDNNLIFLFRSFNAKMNHSFDLCTWFDHRTKNTIALVIKCIQEKYKERVPYLHCCKSSHELNTPFLKEWKRARTTTEKKPRWIEDNANFCRTFQNLHHLQYLWDGLSFTASAVGESIKGKWATESD